MIKVNEYFEGKVKSLGFNDGVSQASVGVIVPGDYEFDTATKEVMTVVSGILKVQLPGTEEWVDYSAGKSFEIEPGNAFKVKSVEPVSYICRYY